MYHKIKKHIYLLLHPAEGDSHWDKIINTFLITLIILNVIAVMLETVEPIHVKYKSFFDTFDLVSVIIFSIEYLLRLWSANHHDKYRHSIKGRIKYIFSFGAIIDLLAILPYYLNVFVGFDLRVLRIFRLVRILRLFRLTAYMKSSQVIINIFRNRFNELLLSFILVIFLIIISSCIIYFAEHLHPDPVQAAKFKSIPATLWWAVVTLTTTGYGDVYPMTTLGRILTGVIMLSGVAFFALPAGIITAGFLEEFRKVKSHKTKNCPHCGKPIDLEDHDHH